MIKVYQALIDEIFEKVNQSKRYHVLHQARYQLDLVPDALLGDLDDLLLTLDTFDWYFGMHRMFEDKPERDRLQKWHN